MSRNLFNSAHDESADGVHSRLQSSINSSRHFDASSVVLAGDGLSLAPVGQTATFSIESRDIEAGDVSVKITG